MTLDAVTWRSTRPKKRMGAAPRTTCAREVEEELGLTRAVGRLLCMEWQGTERDRSESLMFIYDGGVLSDPSTIRLPADELASYRFVDPDDRDALMVERLPRRIRAALRALADAAVAELEDGALAEDGFVPKE